MKLIYQCFLFAAIVHSAFPGNSVEEPHPQPRDESVDNYITMVLENFAVAMREGVPVLGMPVLDPIHISNIDLYGLKWKHSSLDANISDIVVQGISYYIPTYVHLQYPDVKLFLSLSLEEINMTGNYWCNGVYKRFFPIFGSGPFDIEVYKTTVNGSGGAYITDDHHLQITYLDLYIVFEELRVHLNNFLGGGDFGDQMNEMISVLGKLIFDSAMPWVNDKVVPVLVNFINKALMQHTIGEIIKGALPDFPPST